MANSVVKGLAKTYKGIKDTVVGSYDAIENGVVGGYKAVETTAVGAYKVVETAAIDFGRSLVEEYDRLKSTK